MNLNQLKKDACRTLALIELIERSVSKARIIAGSSYYSIYGGTNEQSDMLSFQNRVTERLVKYLEKITSN